MLVLSLITVLAATPLRLVEAAHDFALALAESGSDDGIEMLDGGVGDDSGATTKAEITTTARQADDGEILVTDLGFVLPPPWSVLKRLAETPLRAVASLQRRFALFQCFLC